MSKFINTLKSIDPTILVALVLMFAVGFIVGKQTASKDVKKHYIVDASEVEIVYHNPYKALTLDECVTDWECEIAQLIADSRDGKLISTDDPIFFPNAVPVIEPTGYKQGESPSDCKTGDKECEQANKLNAGKPAHYPAICEPYIFSSD